ncbi:MAG: hypothetical protein RLZZ200_2127, partial [Pseudomonadota bacterium]
KTTIAGLLLLALAPPALAHHSAVQFDFTKQVSYTGTVKEFKAINPHMALTIEVKDAKGTHDVLFEGHSTNNMYRTGYRKGMVNVGDTVTVNCAPQKDGREGGYVVSVSTANGGFFGMKSSRLAQDATTTRSLAEGK